MSEFKVIETQEQLDAVIGERIKRERESVAKKYEGWTSPDDLQKIQEDHQTQIKVLEEAATKTQETIDQKDAQIADATKYKTDLEKTRIVVAAGLDMKYADRLQGETAEEWKADADALAKDFAAAHVTAPLGSNEPNITKEPSTEEKFKEWFNQQV